MTRSFGDEVASRVGVIAEPGKYLQFSFINMASLLLNSNYCDTLLA